MAHYASIEPSEEVEMWTKLLKPPSLELSPEILTGGLLDLKHVDRLRGLHLIRRAQLEQQNLPVQIQETMAEEVRTSKLSLRRNRPLVTLSYLSHLTPHYSYGAGEVELTQLTQSWAPTYINAGCSAFIGPLWAVDEAVEAAFVSTFYAELWKGASLGEAFRRAQKMARVAVPERVDWLAYILFGDPMARPYRPVKGNGYAVVEPVGRQKNDPVSPGASARFRVKLRRTPPVWHEDRVIEVADELLFDDLQVHIIAPDLTIKPASPIEMVRTPEGDYLGWCTLLVPDEITDSTAHVQLYFVHEEQMIHSLMFSLPLNVMEVNDGRL